MGPLRHRKVPEGSLVLLDSSEVVRLLLEPGDATCVDQLLVGRTIDVEVPDGALPNPPLDKSLVELLEVFGREVRRKLGADLSSVVEGSLL